MLPTLRPPTHPGEMLLKEFLEALGVSRVEAAAGHMVGGRPHRSSAR
jgi:plasmid maintenance system antidote protein VapI